MSKIKELKGATKRVKSILEAEPRARDNDNLLAVLFWQGETGKFNRSPDLYDVSDFLKDFVSGEFTSPESIGRARRLVQEHYPETRGAKYHDRHKLAAEVRDHVSEVMDQVDVIIDSFRSAPPQKQGSLFETMAERFRPREEGS